MSDLNPAWCDTPNPEPSCPTTTTHPTTTVDAPPKTTTTVTTIPTTTTTRCVLNDAYQTPCNAPPRRGPVFTIEPTTSSTAAQETTTSQVATSITQEPTTALVGHPGGSAAPPSSLPVTGGSLILVPLALGIVALGKGLKHLGERHD